LIIERGENLGYFVDSIKILIDESQLIGKIHKARVMPNQWFRHLIDAPQVIYQKITLNEWNLLKISSNRSRKFNPEYNRLWRKIWHNGFPLINYVLFRQFHIFPSLIGY
jgi:hypothetical protein